MSLGRYNSQNSNEEEFVLSSLETELHGSNKELENDLRLLRNCIPREYIHFPLDTNVQANSTFNRQDFSQIEDFIKKLDAPKQVTSINLMINLFQLHMLTEYKPFSNCNYLPLDLNYENTVGTSEMNFHDSSQKKFIKKDYTNGMKKKRIFHITKEKNSLKKIRAVKNNKVVFVNSFTPADIALLKKGENLVDSTKLSTRIKSGKLRISRGSKYRGVSRNGNKWQVLLMTYGKKKYAGSFNDEKEAAAFYDKITIQYHGKRAKTNFFYTTEEINRIINSSPVMK